MLVKKGNYTIIDDSEKPEGGEIRDNGKDQDKKDWKPKVEKPKSEKKKKVKETILKNIIAATKLNRNQLIQKIRNFEHQTQLPLNLKNFLNINNIY